MRTARSIFCLLIVSFACIAHAGESSHVFPGETGRLLHLALPTGDRIPDFSAVGYGAGEVPLPDVVTAITVAPAAGDDTSAIQAAIDAVQAMPLNANGFRGAVQLQAGEYQIGTWLNINQSGVVLRGVGDETASGGGTVLQATGTTQRSVVRVGGGGSRSKIGSSERSVLDKYVPVGATSLRVQDANTFAVGDSVVVFRPSTASWISDLGMDMLPPRSDGGTVTQWSPGSKNLHSERVITRIEGDRLFIDAPITNSLSQEYGGGSVYKYNFSNRLENVGIENLRGVSDYDTSNPFDEDHAWTFISMDDLDHGWVRDVTAQHFGKNTVSLERDAKHVTVVDSHSVQPISKITGSRRYSFEVDGQLNIVRDSTAEEGRHDFIMNSASPGPNVFFNNLATDTEDESGPHQRYSTGGLFDNVVVQGDQINLRNRGNFGTGHGWAGANMVIWNSTADSFIVQNPPEAQNWLIGSVGTYQRDTRFGVQEDGILDHHGEHVETSSLYLQQLADRTSLPGSQNREYVLGDYDEFEMDAGSDDPFVTGAAQTAFASLLTNANQPGFDDVSANNVIPFSWEFELAADERVVHAVMSVALKKAGGSTSGDAVYFESPSNVLQFAADLGLTAELSSTDATVVLFEFTTASELGDFRDGEFNVLFTDDVAIDWARMDLTVADELIGDFDFDGQRDAADINLMCAAMGTDVDRNVLFDLNGDSAINGDDLLQLVEDEIGTHMGDANLDFAVNAADFVIWNANRFAVGGWGEGNFLCDGFVDVSDLNIWNANRTQSGLVVPEPSHAGWFGFCLWLVVAAVRRTRTS